MKILFITSHPIQYNAPLFSYLSKYSNYTVKVFYTLGKNNNVSLDNGFGVREHWNIDLLSGYDFEFIENTSSRPSSLTYWGIKNPSIFKNIRCYNPDAIIIYGWKYHSHFSVLQYFHKKIPIIFRGDSTTLDDSLLFSFRSYFRYAFLKLIYSKVDFVLSPGSASDSYFIKSGVQEANIIRSVHAVDNFRFSVFSEDDHQSLSAIKDRLAIAIHDTVFLFAGKFIDKKNPLLLVKAFNKVAIKNQNVRLVIVGDGILESAIKQHITNLDHSIGDRIHLFPFQDQQNIKLFYRLASVFILPSKSETWGLSINEALVSGTPVLVSNQCGCAYEIVQEGKNGYIFKSDDLNDLEAKMLLCCNEKHRNFLASNAAKSASGFSFHAIKESIDKIISLIEK